MGLDPKDPEPKLRVSLLIDQATQAPQLFTFLSIGGGDKKLFIFLSSLSITIKEFHRKYLGKMTETARTGVCLWTTLKIKAHKLPVIL